MSIEVSYSDLRQHLADYMDRAVADNEVIKIHRKSNNGVVQDVALISAAELESLQETAHLLRSPKNAERLFNALTRALAQQGEQVSIDDLEQLLGLKAYNGAGEIGLTEEITSSDVEDA